MKKILLSLFLIFILLFVSCEEDPNDNPDNNNNNNNVVEDENPDNNNSNDNVVKDVLGFKVKSPYATVNWSTWEQYRAGHHTHTTSSDGSGSITAMVEAYYAKDYDMLAITDHNYMWPLTTNWNKDRNTHVNFGDSAMSDTRYEEVTTGSDRGGVPMLEIPYTSEIAIYPDEINTFFFNKSYPNSFNGGAAMRTVLNELQKTDGALAHVNHPGRATGGAAVAAQSNNPTHINFYSGLFRDYSKLLGFEIVNRADGDTRNDRILWDNVLKIIIPEGKRNVFGFANDDAHSTSSIAISWNIMIMPSNTLENIRTAMTNGTFYPVATTAHRELGNGFTGTGDAPKITNIVIGNDDSLDTTITITAEYANKIQWVSDGKIIKEGTFSTSDTLELYDYDEGKGIGSYVRANIMGPGGIAFTQPFIVEKEH